MMPWMKLAPALVVFGLRNKCAHLTGSNAIHVVRRVVRIKIAKAG
jgi:hypothetical protein